MEFMDQSPRNNLRKKNDLIIQENSLKHNLSKKETRIDQNYQSKHRKGLQQQQNHKSNSNIKPHQRQVSNIPANKHHVQNESCLPGINQDNEYEYETTAANSANVQPTQKLKSHLKDLAQIESDLNKLKDVQKQSKTNYEMMKMQFKKNNSKTFYNPRQGNRKA